MKGLAQFMEVTITPEGLERIIEHSSLEGMRKTYAKIEEDYEYGKMLTRAFGQIPFIQKGKKILLTISQVYLFLYLDLSLHVTQHTGIVTS